MTQTIISTQFCGSQLPDIPYVTQNLLKLHGRIVTTFDALTENRNPICEVIERIACIASSIIVYPALALLFIAGKSCSASKCSNNNVQENFSDKIKAQFRSLEFKGDPKLPYIVFTAVLVDLGKDKKQVVYANNPKSMEHIDEGLAAYNKNVDTVQEAVLAIIKENKLTSYSLEVQQLQVFAVDETLFQINRSIDRFTNRGNSGTSSPVSRSGIPINKLYSELQSQLSHVKHIQLPKSQKFLDFNKPVYGIIEVKTP